MSLRDNKFSSGSCFPQLLAAACQRGFSLLEMIIVIFIVTAGLIGILSLVSQNIIVANINKNTLIASQLAQEGLELVRNVRDGNWLDGADWKLGAGGFGSDSDIVQDGDYAIDYTGIISAAGINDMNAALKINGNFYEHGAGADTPFNRLIQVNDNGNYIEVECVVQWRDRGQLYDYTASTVLYDWR